MIINKLDMVFTMINKKNIYEQLTDISSNFILFNYNMKTLYPIKYIRASNDIDNKYMVDILLKLEYLSHSYRAIPVTMMSFSGQNIYFNYISDFLMIGIFIGDILMLKLLKTD